MEKYFCIFIAVVIYLKSIWKMWHNPLFEVLPWWGGGLVVGARW